MVDKMCLMRVIQTTAGLLVALGVFALTGGVASGDVTTGDGPGRPTFADPGLTGDRGAALSPGTSITGGPTGSGFFSAPPIEHDTPETASKPTIVGRIDPGRLEPVVAEATKFDHTRVGEAEVLLAPAVKDTGLWKTLQEVQINPVKVVATTVVVTGLFVALVVAISRRGAKERARRLTEAGPPVFFEGDVQFEADRDALSRHEQQEGDTPRLPDAAPPADAGPRRSESGLRY
jgi:hypothetical protein